MTESELSTLPEGTEDLAAGVGPSELPPAPDQVFAADEAEADAVAEAAGEVAPATTRDEAHDEAHEDHEDHHDELHEDHHDDVPGAPAAAAPAAQAKGGARGHDARSVGFIALPVNTSQLIKKYGVSHPGLVLNKYAVLLRLQDRRLQYDFSPEQKKRILQKVAHLLATAAPLRAQWQRALESRNRLLALEGARRVSLTSSTPLAFSVYHPFAELGVELHPIHGFPLLPAAHIKGALRGFVTERWLPHQPDAAAAQALIDQIFGQPGQGESGAMIFHDAWPEAWPSLAVELFASHHAPYYQRHEFPGDWQAPQSDSFLVIKPGSRFSFALSRRSPEVADELVQQAEAWLLSMLQIDGLGAYRHQGYGQWKQGSGEHPMPPAAASFEVALSLNAPAFLAGATFRPEDCRLRSGTLRGMLRWWWRTLHSGFLGHRELLALETLLWGGHGRKGAIRLQLEASQNAQARRYRPEDVLRQLPGPEGERRSPGLVYLGYGLFAESAKRYYLGSDARWTLRMEAESVTWQRKEGSIELDADTILQQAQAALWLLSHYGGVGQRKRKAFGSLQEIAGLEMSDERCLDLAQALRSHCQLGNEFSDERAESPALTQRIAHADIATPWQNPWFALHMLGESLQTFMQQHKHEALKQGLGLPRPMDPPVNGEFTPAAPVKQRHASPYYLHLVRDAEQKLSIRVVAFPAAKLPNLEQSRQLLSELVAHLGKDLAERIARWPKEPEIDLSAPPPLRGGRGRPGSDARREGQREGQRDGQARDGQPRPPRRPRPEGAAAEGERPRREGPDRGPRRDRPDRPPRGERRDRPERGDRPRGDRPERGPRREGTSTGTGYDPAKKGTGASALYEANKKNSEQRRGGPAKPAVRSGPRQPQAGDWVDAQLLEERTKKGGWRAEHAGNKLAGPLVNTGLVPGEHNPGDKVELIIHSLNKFEMMFRWPTEAERTQHEKRKK